MKTIIFGALLVAILSGTAHAKGRGWFCYTATDLNPKTGTVTTVGACERTSRKCFDNVVMDRASVVDSGAVFTLKGAVCGAQGTAYTYSYYSAQDGQSVGAFPTLAWCSTVSGAAATDPAMVITRQCGISR